MSEEYHDPDWDEAARTCSLCGSGNIRVKIEDSERGQRRMGPVSRYSEPTVQLHCLGCNRIWEETNESNIEPTDK